MKTRADADQTRIKEVASGLHSGVLTYRALSEELGQPITKSVLISALLSVVALFLDEMPAEWREDAVVQFTKRCTPNKIN